MLLRAGRNAIRPFQLAPRAGSVVPRCVPRALASSSFSTNDRLADLLEKEIDEEEDNFEGMGIDMDGILAQWKDEYSVKVDVGSPVIELEKTVNGNVVKISMDVEDTHEYGEDDDIEEGYYVDVSLHRDKTVLGFRCEILGNEILVANLQIMDAHEVGSDKSIYDGPKFEDLETDLQDAILDYLEDHGIDGALAGSLTEFARAKEQEEYIRWLDRFHHFVSA